MEAAGCACMALDVGFQRLSTELMNAGNCIAFIVCHVGEHDNALLPDYDLHNCDRAVQTLCSSNEKR